jgi:DNA polymerase III subunit alpha
MSELAYLHVHTRFSLGGGPSSPRDWCLRASELGYKALGIADRAPLAGMAAFARAAASAGLTPIYGVELDLRLPEAGGEQPVQPALLFATGPEGLRNLMKLSSQAYAGWPRAVQAIGSDDLASHSGGLVLVLPGWSESGVLTPLLSAHEGGVTEWVAGLNSQFEHLFIGLPHSGGPGDDALAARVAEAASSLGLRLAALPTARYLRAEHAQGYRALRLARERAGWAGSAAGGGPGEDTAPQFLRPPGEAAALFAEWPQAIENAAAIVQMCSAEPVDLGSLWRHETGPALEELKARAKQHLPGIAGEEEHLAGFGQRLDAELAALGGCASPVAWRALASLADLARSTRAPLGAPLGGADGSLLAAALGVSGLPTAVATGQSDTRLPPGVEIPGTRRGELLGALASELGTGAVALAACAVEIAPMAAVQAAGDVLGIAGEHLERLLGLALDGGWEALSQDLEGAPNAGEAARLASSLRGAPVLFKPDPDTLLVGPGDAPLAERAPLLSCEGLGVAAWVPWSREALCDLDCPALWVRGSAELSLLDKAWRLASDYPVAELDAGGVDLPAYPALSDAAASLLKHGELAGIPYLSTEALKGWKGGFTPEEVAALVARSLGPPERPKAPAGLAAWDESTADTGGALLYFDQFEAIAGSAAGIPLEATAALRQALLNPESDAGGSMRARFLAGCLASGLDAEAAGALLKAMSAPGLVSRQAALAWARATLWLAELKAAHPAAFLAAALDVAWERGPGAVRPLAEEARRVGVSISPPDAARGGAGPVPDLQGDGRSIAWGLAMLPGWSRGLAGGFVAARDAGRGLGSLADLAALAAEVGLLSAQTEALVRSGACEALGGRDVLLEILPSALEWGKSGAVGEEPPGDLPPDAVLSPRQRYLRRAWEERNLGVGFTPAPEMEALSRAMDGSGGLRSRLTTTAQIETSMLGRSIYLVGLLHAIRLVESPGSTASGNGHGAPGAAEAQSLAVAWVEDLDGAIELVAFPPNYRRHSELWAESNLVIVTARVSRYPGEEELYLLCEHLAAYQAGIEEGELNFAIKAPRRPTQGTAPLPTPEAPPGNGGSRGPHPDQVAPASRGSEAASHRAPPQVESVASTGEPPGYHLVISLPGSQDDRADIDSMIALKKLLESHPGPDTVTLRIPYSPETGAVTTARLPRGVRYTSSLEEGIRGLLGAEALALIKLLG